MLHPSTKKLIDRLAAMTAQKKIDWIEKDNGDVLYATEGYVVRLTPEPPRVLLSTESGKSLEDASSTVLTATAREDGGTYGDLVTTLARDACRDARGTEDAINTLLAGLSDTPAETADETPEAVTEEPEVDHEDEAVADAALSGEAVIEDPVDETTALSAAVPDPAESDVESTWSSQETTSHDARGDWADDEPDEDLVDASVPEAAIVNEAEIDEDVSAASSEADVTNAETDELESEDDTDSEHFVGGAVARLADEVNADPADPSETDTVSEAETLNESPDEPEEGLGADDTAIMEQADDTDEAPETDDETPLTPSYSIQPDDAPILGDEPDETAPEAAAPVEPAGIDGESSSQDDEMELEGTGWNEPVEDTDLAADPDDSFDHAPASEDVSATAPAVDDSETTEPAEVEVETATAATTEQSPAASNVHYIPFGAGGIEAEGADVSEQELAETPHDTDEETESSLATAATMMSAPAAADAEDDTSSAEEGPETGDVFGGDTDPSTMQAAPLSGTSDEAPLPDDPVSAPQADSETEAPAEQASPGPISLSGMAAGHGFGRTATGFQPTAPSPSPVRREDEHVSRAPVFIDATDDYTDEISTAAESANVPELTDLDTSQDFVEASVSDEDLDAVAPQEATVSPQKPEAESALSLVDSGPSDQQVDETEEEPRTARPKTRFNPWT